MNRQAMKNRREEARARGTVPRVGAQAVRSALGAFVASALLAGCAVGPDYHAPSLAVPARWSAAPADGHSAVVESPAQLAQWWRRLGDPQLDRLIDEALAGNLDVASARAKLREARASYRQAGAALWPSLTGSGSAKRAGNGAQTASSSTTSDSATSSSTLTSAGSPYSIFQAGFDASWELDLFGANRRATEAAKYGLDAAGWNVRSTQLTLIGDVATYYVAARGYQARLALARDTAASQQETARLTHARFEAGAASALDAANAQGLAQTTLATIPALESAYAQAVHSLSVLTGQPPDALDSRMAQATPIPVPRLPIPAGVPADVLLARPDVRLAERQYAQYTAKIGQAEAARYPSVSLTGSVATSGTQFGDLGRRSTIGWSIGPTLSLPLFNAGKLKAAVEVAEAQRDQYFVAYRLAVLNALKDVENASVALSRESARVEALRASAASYREASTLAHALYGAGSTGFLDVLIAERSLYSAQDSLIQSEVLVTTEYVSLNKALGGGWDGAADVDAQ